MRRFSLPATFLVTVGLLVPAALAGVKDPVTVIGATVLDRSDAVVRGTVERASRLAAGAIVVHFTVVESLFGPAVAGTVALLTEDPALFPPPGVPCILFMSALSGARYRPVQCMELTGGDAEPKERILRRYIEIEAMTDPATKRAALRELLVENLGSTRPFLVYSAARELAHFTEENAALLSAEEAAALRKAREEARDPLLVDLLDTSIERLPEAPAAPEGPEPEGPGKHLLPPEFTMLASAWDRGLETPGERLYVLTSICARHLKHARAILLSALSDPDAEVREMAAREVGEAGITEAIKPLVALLGREKERSVLLAAIGSLGVLKAEEALASVEEFAKDRALIRAVATAIARIGTPAAVDFLKGLRQTRAEADPEFAKHVDFLLSDTFREQEEALGKVRAARLR